jgi:hypothetical protein
MNSIIQRHSSSSFSKMSYGSQIDPVDHSTAINIVASINRTGSALSCNEYDNSKNTRRDSSFASLVSEQAQQTLIRARSPHEILSSLHHDMSWALLRGFAASIVAFLVGVHGPKAWFLPLMGGLTMRPIPYQMTNAGDVLLDLGLANELIPKSEVTFPCECQSFPMLIVCIVTASSHGLLHYSSLDNFSRKAVLSITLGSTDHSYCDWRCFPSRRIVSSKQQLTPQYSCRSVYHLYSYRDIRVRHTNIQILRGSTSS